MGASTAPIATVLEQRPIAPRSFLHHSHDHSILFIDCEPEVASGSQSIPIQTSLMKQTSLPFFGALVVLFLTFFSAPAASAHGDEPRLEISADRLNPGSVLDLRGAAFEAEEAVTLTLIGPQNEVPLGSVLADTEGIFVRTLTLPVDLVEGTYVVRATTDDHAIDSPPITISGTADPGAGDDGQRTDEDPLLAPMPTVPPGPYPTALPQTTTSQAPASQGISTTLLYAILAGVGIVVLLGIRTLKKS